jgi:hypothetical protein
VIIDALFFGILFTSLQKWGLSLLGVLYTLQVLKGVGTFKRFQQTKEDNVFRKA